MSSRKQRAIALLQMAGTGQVDEAYAAYIAPSFIHHNQYFKGDRQSLLDAMKMAHQMSPNRLVEVRQAIEEGDTVVTFSRVVRQKPDEPDIAVVHIFRFDGDQIVELWDVGQLVSKDSPNEHGVF